MDLALVSAASSPPLSLSVIYSPLHDHIQTWLLLFRRYGCKMIRALVSLMKTVDSKPKIEHVFYITNRMKMFSEH